MSKQAAKRYAKALFEYAGEEGVLDSTREELLELSKLVSGSAELVSLFEHPLIPEDKRRKALTALFKDKTSELVFRFLILLDEKGRLGIFPEITRTFEALFQEHQGVLNVRVNSAVPLDEDQQSRLQKRLKEKYKKEIQLHLKVDPALVGGFRIQVGDQVLDSSVSHLLETFKLALIRTK